MEFFTELIKAFSPSEDAFVFMWLLAAMGLAAMIIALERWVNLSRCTDYDAEKLFEKVKRCLDGRQNDEAYSLCASGGGFRALPRILAAGIKRAKEVPNLVAAAMAEESAHMTSLMEKRLNLLVMFGNVFTLMGLLGTVYGLIMSFEAVSKPEVAAIEKSALLAAGISTAMNSTLVGLSLSVLTVMLYAFIRSRVDASLSEIDHYSIATLNLLVPSDVSQKKRIALGRGGEEEVADADVTPMLNLMVILIPILLTSSEFVKIGAIELKLPEASQGSGGIGESAIAQDAKLDLGVVITSKGFRLFNYFKSEDTLQQAAATGEIPPDIPLVDGKYNFESLGAKLAEVKKKVLLEIVRASLQSDGGAMSLYQLYAKYASGNFSSVPVFSDHESIKIVAEDKITYETVVSVMDAARGMRTHEGNVTMFPNVAIAGGIIQ